MLRRPESHLCCPRLQSSKQVPWSMPQSDLAAMQHPMRRGFLPPGMPRMYPPTLVPTEPVGLCHHPAAFLRQVETQDVDARVHKLTLPDFVDHAFLLWFPVSMEDFGSKLAHPRVAATPARVYQFELCLG